MNRRSLLAAIATGGASLTLQRPAAGQDRQPTAPASAAAQADAIRKAASGFLRTLAPDRRDRVTFAFPGRQSPAAIGFGPMLGRPGGPGSSGHPPRDVSFDGDGHPMLGADPGGPPHGPHPGPPPAAGERYGQAVWTNFPVSIVPRPGVQIGDLTPAERESAHTLLRVVLSPMGYRKVLDIMDADQKVADAGPDYSAGLDVYTIGLFGKPSETSPWMLQFGGHHLGLNVIFVGDKAVCAPLHTGILPARFEANGHIVRGLGRESDKAFGLVATFTPDQLKAATIDHDVSVLVRGPGYPDAKLLPQGLPGVRMTEVQQAALVGLIAEWVGVLNDAQSAQRLDTIRTSIAETRFAWSGPVTHEAGRNGEAYFRIHGPDLLIEYAPQRNQGGYQVHVHTVMRDLDNDYGRTLV